MNKDTDKNQSTTNFYLAVFLSVKGLDLIGIDRSDAKRARFIFAESPQWKQFIEAFSFAKDNDPKILIDARKFIVVIKSLKDKLYQDHF